MLRVTGLVLELREPFREVARTFQVGRAPQHLAVAGETAWLACGSTLYRCGASTSEHVQAGDVLALLTTDSDVWVITFQGLLISSSQPCRWQISD